MTVLFKLQNPISHPRTRALSGYRNYKKGDTKLISDIEKKKRPSSRKRHETDEESDTVYRKGMTPEQYKAAIIADFKKRVSGY